MTNTNAWMNAWNPLPPRNKFGVPNWSFEYPEPRSQKTFGVGQKQFSVTFPVLSRGAQYHLDTLLAYAEVCIYRESPTSSQSMSNDLGLRPANFTKYNELTDELKLLIIKHAVSEDHPRRIILHSKKSNTPPPRFSHLKDVDTMWREEYLLCNGPVLLDTRYPNLNNTRVMLPHLDMLYLSNKFSFQMSSTSLLEFFHQQGKLQDIRCMAVSTRVPGFSNFIRSFSRYTGLELVFIVLEENGEPQLVERRWGLKQSEKHHDLSYPQEPMFEIMHPTNGYLNGYNIPGFQLRAGRTCLFHKEPEALEVLHRAMARKQADGTLISPHLRFVRLIHCAGMV